MSDKKKQKFSLSDIIRKINEEKTADSAVPNDPSLPPITIPDPAPPQAEKTDAVRATFSTTHDHVSGVAALPEKEHPRAKLDVPLYTSASGS